ncbi:antitermination protein N [Citrobacter freundii]|uniref:antitermination protein N n=1 Tax=Citrobacter freundii TaxID=546 RepID=UPI0015A7B329|nr:antitermination protein N [Citrobacter freundii]QLD07667.1 antitermination protein [Citrobacter freundii]
MDAQARRRERRAEKQAEWNAANPLLVGVSAKPESSRAIKFKRSVNRIGKAVEPIKNEMATQILKAAEFHQANRLKLERRMHLNSQKDSNPFGNKIHAVQKSRGKSTPLI